MGKLFYHAMCNEIDALRDGLEKKIEPVDTCEDENTPLLIACQKGNLAAVKLLLDHGADIYLRDKEYGDTCLQRILIIAGRSFTVPKYANYPGCFSAILEHEQRLPVSQRNPGLLEIVNHRGMRPADYIVFKLGRFECPKVYTELQQALNDHLQDLRLEAQSPPSGIKFWVRVHGVRRSHRIHRSLCRFRQHPAICPLKRTGIQVFSHYFPTFG